MGQSGIVLCGGVFFYLLLQTQTPGVTAKDHLAGKSNTFTEKDMLSDLMKVISPDWSKTIPSSTTSGYKTCEKQFNSLFGKSSQNPPPDLIIESFDKRIREDYTSCLTVMEEFVENYITSDRSIWLDFIKALLEVIWDDESIHLTDLFFEDWDGRPLKDNISLGTELDIYFPAFLLGIWHFVVVNRKDNKVGAATIKKWIKEGKAPGCNNNFKRIIGEGHCSEISIKLVDGIDWKSRIPETGAASSGDGTGQNLQVANKEATSPRKTVAGRIRRLFDLAYTDCRINVFLADESENKNNSDLLPWVDRFIEYIERDILQGYYGISLDSDAVILQSTIRSYVNTLRDYKSDLIQYIEKKNRDWYLTRPEIPVLKELQTQEFDTANISTVRDAVSGRATRKEISIEDSLEHRRKRLDQLYTDIVKEN